MGEELCNVGKVLDEKCDFLVYTVGKLVDNKLAVYL